MRVAVQKLEGVEKVDVSLERSEGVITFKADNRITLPQIRRTIRNSGYPTRDAQITARGQIAERQGTPVLDLLNGAVLELASKPADVPTHPVEITGVSRENAKKIEQLTIGSVKRQ